MSGHACVRHRPTPREPRVGRRVRLRLVVLHANRPTSFFVTRPTLSSYIASSSCIASSSYITSSSSIASIAASSYIASTLQLCYAVVGALPKRVLPIQRGLRTTLQACSAQLTTFSTAPSPILATEYE